MLTVWQVLAFLAARQERDGDGMAIFQACVTARMRHLSQLTCWPCWPLYLISHDYHAMTGSCNTSPCPSDASCYKRLC